MHNNELRHLDEPHVVHIVVAQKNRAITLYHGICIGICTYRPWLWSLLRCERNADDSDAEVVAWRASL